MDITTMERNAAAVHATLVETKAGELITTKGCKIYTPARYAGRKLAVIADEIRVVAVFAIVVEDKYYAVSSAPSLMQLTPSSMSLVDIEGEEYYEFSFDKGACVTPSVDLLQDDTIPYFLYDELIAKGHVPWYLGYLDLARLITDSKYYTGVSFAASNVPMEMIVASITRDRKERRLYYRHQINSLADEVKNPPAFIAFRNIIYGATNTTAKLMGSFLDDGVLSAVVNPSEQTEGVETLLRR